MVFFVPDSPPPLFDDYAANWRNLSYKWIQKTDNAEKTVPEIFCGWKHKTAYTHLYQYVTDGTVNG